MVWHMDLAMILEIIQFKGLKQVLIEQGPCNPCEAWQELKKQFYRYTQERSLLSTKTRTLGLAEFFMDGFYAVTYRETFFLARKWVFSGGKNVQRKDSLSGEKEFSWKEKSFHKWKVFHSGKDFLSRGKSSFLKKKIASMEGRQFPGRKDFPWKVKSFQLWKAPSKQ